MTLKLHALASIVVLMLASAACGGSPAAPIPHTGGPAPRPSLNPTYRPSGHMAAGDVFVQLFEWKWTDIANECQQVLGPVGYKAVQISPPEEHSEVPTHDWSERYQPVSYTIARSRSGDSTQFVDMVQRCKAAGVDIYADAVLNHMTNYPSPGVGSDGTAYTKFNYPGLYTPSDFHTPCLVDDYSSAANVQDCELDDLPDLNTALPYVRQTLADYLIKLARLGVAGFRIDAAKHIQQVDLDDILTIVDSTLQAEGRPIPYYFLEISSGPGEALTPQDYFGEAYRSGGAADITEFKFQGVGDKFLGTGGQHISQLDPNGPPGNQFSAAAWGLIPSDKAVVFLENHDSQHDVGRISYRDGQVFRLANVWMLAQPYGYPKILSSYAFSRPVQNSMGPPSDANGNTNNVVCAPSLEQAVLGEWVCEHRDPMIEAMVGFRHVVAGTPIDHWWDDGNNAIAFSRGDKGFVAISRESAEVDTTIATGMPPGQYCDLLSGGVSGTGCAGATMTVDSTGAIQLRLAANSAVAIDAATRR